MQDLMTLTAEQQKAVNDYLIDVVQKSYRCSHCMLSHCSKFCFFAYDCVRNDFSHWCEPND